MLQRSFPWLTGIILTLLFSVTAIGCVPTESDLCVEDPALCAATNLGSLPSPLLKRVAIHPLDN